MKTLKFRSNLVEKILNGEKPTTWRLFDDKDIKLGDKIECINWESKESFAKILVEEVTEKPFKELNDVDWKGHEKFDSEEEMYSKFSEYYDSPVEADTIVKIIKFKILKDEDTKN